MASTKTKTIKITYDLNLPSSVEAGDRPTSRTFDFPIVFPSSSSSTNTQGGREDVNATLDVDVKAYCASLRKTLEVARNEVGDELTMWRDVVGKDELSKEPRKGRGGEEEEEEEGEI